MDHLENRSRIFLQRGAEIIFGWKSFLIQRVQSRGSSKSHIEQRRANRAEAMQGLRRALEGVRFFVEETIGV